ncbi:MAG: DUF3488 domain-containing protein [Nocardioides sp.]
MTIPGATGPRSTAILLPLVVAATGWVTMLSWRGFSREASSYLFPLAVGALMIATAGIVLRLARVPGAAVVLTQLVLAAAFLALLLTGSPAPIGARWSGWSPPSRERWRPAGSTRPRARRGPGHPSPADPARPAAARGLRRRRLLDAPGSAGRALPARGVRAAHKPARRGRQLGAVRAGRGRLSHDGAARRGRPAGALGRTLAGSGGRLTQEMASAGSRRAGALGIGATATAVAVLVPSLLPTLQLGVFGNGPGSGDRDVTLINPITDLRRDLQRGADVPLLTLTTDDPSPSYLRIAVLNRFTHNEWSSGNRDIPADQVPNGEMPPPPGVNQAVERTRHRYRVSVTDDFRSTWLPVMSPVTRVVAPGNWRYDASTMDFIAADEDTTTAGISYDMTGVELDLSQQLLDRAPNPTGSVDPLLTDLPADLPSSVSQLAAQVTAGRTTKYQRGGRAAAVVPQHRRLHLLRARPDRQRHRRPARSSTPRPGRSATASSSPPRWRSWRAPAASRPGWPWAS